MEKKQTAEPDVRSSNQMGETEMTLKSKLGVNLQSYG
jgi:hypothetical protein